MSDSRPLEVALKVDVCNRRALDRGVPGLLALLGELGVHASFFVAFGPDHSGRALRRIFRPGFVTKMVRTRAPRMYGLRTLLYGTLLPAPPVGESAPELLRQLEAAGHEVGLHGFDHVAWHDGVAHFSDQAVRASYQEAARRFEAALGHPARFSGAPGWQVSEASLRVQEELGLDWASDTREGAPFYPLLSQGRLQTLQVPTRLLTSDEVLGAGEAASRGLPGWYASRLRQDTPTVIGVHAEAEGIHFSAWLRAFLQSLRARHARFLLLSEVAERARESAPARRVVQRRIPGRADCVACPGEAEA